MMIAVLFVSCCCVSGTVDSTFCCPRSDVGSSFSCCGLPVYPAYGHFVNRVRRMAVGWVDFWWPVCHQFQRCFFVLEFTSLFTPNFIPATACFSMLLYPHRAFVGISHAPRQTARLSLTLASSTASWCLYMPLARSGRLIESSSAPGTRFELLSLGCLGQERCFERLPMCPGCNKRKPRLTDWFMTAQPASNQRLCWGRTSLLDCKPCHQAQWKKSGSLCLLTHLHRWIYQNRDKTLLFSLFHGLTQQCIWFPDCGLPLTWSKNGLMGQSGTRYISLWLLKGLNVRSSGKMFMLWIPTNWYKMCLTVKYTWKI